MLNLSQAVFFDIETTGFSASSSIIYLIGALSFEKGQYHCRQWFARTPDEEPKILSSFFNYLNNYTTIISFNGERFDIPFLIRRSERWNVSCPLSSLCNLDIYQKFRPYKNLFSLEHINQKSLENFLGLEREDKYNGGELIPIYKHYCKHPDDKESEQLLLLHNHDDLYGMTFLIPLLAYDNFLANGGFSISSLEWNEHLPGHPQLIISLLLDIPVPKQISCPLNYGYLTAQNTKARLLINAFEGELKYFFPDYQNYYYLPEYGYAIHKHAAQFLPSSQKEKAKASNCYQLQHGLFLPSASSDFEPVFRMEYKSTDIWFQCTDEFMNSSDKLFTYIKESLIFR